MHWYVCLSFHVSVVNIFPSSNFYTGPRTFSGSKPEVTTTIPPFNHSTESPTVSRSSSSSSEAMAGILVGIVGVMLATVVPVVVLLVFVYKKRHRRKQLERVQMDILAM